MTYGMNDEIYWYYLTDPEQYAIKHIVILIADIKTKPDITISHLPIKTNFQAITDDLYTAFEHINDRAEQRYIDMNIDDPAIVYKHIKRICDHCKNKGDYDSSAFEIIKKRHIWEKLDGKTDLDKLLCALRYECDIQLKTLAKNPDSKRHLTLAQKYIHNTAQSIIESKF